jgi:hypothetical protein
MKKGKNYRNNIMLFKALSNNKRKQMFLLFFEFLEVKFVSELGSDVLCKFVKWRKHVNMHRYKFGAIADSTIMREVRELKKILPNADGFSFSEQKKSIVPLEIEEQRDVLDKLKDKPKYYEATLSILLDGKKLCEVDSSSAFKQALNRYTGISPIQLRHAFAVNNLIAGVSLESVSKQLGHSRVYLTRDMYGDFVPHKTLGMEAARQERKEFIEWLDSQRTGGQIIKPLNIVGNSGWDDFRNIMFWHRKNDPVLQLMPADDYAAELWLTWRYVVELPYDPDKRADRMGYMCLVGKRRLREIALSNYQVMKQSRYYYKKDGDIKGRTTDFSILEV